MTESRRLKQLLRRALEHLDEPVTAAKSEHGDMMNLGWGMAAVPASEQRHDRADKAAKLLLVLDIQEALRPEGPS